ncbi:alpha/beta fold hydrolase [Streptomyces sp. NPDC002018]|uniref:alpha/beta fold hydrolase n=1 Tax=Streptomyces sp. NPDC002018 TaxID=3364629 RepID=UPI0036ACE5FF
MSVPVSPDIQHSDIQHPGIELRRVKTNGTELNVATAGQGPAVLLLHGFPQTWQMWIPVMAELAQRYRVIAPDLRGFGASAREADGYDAITLAADAEGLLEALGETSVAVVGIDIGVPPAFLLAMRRQDLVRRLVLMESLLGQLPGAEGEEFLTADPPWWFGFHSVPGLAESVLPGHEEIYVDWFLDRGTSGRGIRPDIREAIVRGYTGSEALRCAFSVYRARPLTARQIQEAVNSTRLTIPTMVIGANPVGRALELQVRPHADDVEGHVLTDCGHIIPLDRPDALLTLLRPFLSTDGR